MTGATYFVGLDLGQSQDFTAAAVVERVELAGEWDAVVYAHRKATALRLRHVERMPLGTPYPEVVDRVERMTARVGAMGPCHLVADATGVGRPVVDLLRRAGLGCRLWPALITGGETEGHAQGYYRVPKQDLIVGLQVRLEKGELDIASGMSYGRELVAELGEMRAKVGRSGREQYGAWRQGQHDDLVMAVSLACWGVGKVFPRAAGGYCGRLL